MYKEPISSSDSETQRLSQGLDVLLKLITENVSQVWSTVCIYLYHHEAYILLFPPVTMRNDGEQLRVSFVNFVPKDPNVSMSYAATNSFYSHGN